MSSVQTALAALIVMVIPVAFLLLIYYLDLYANCSLRLVAFCFVWGALVGLGIAYGVNTYITLPLIKGFRLDYLLFYVVFAPVTEEVVKSIPLLYVARQSRFTYFVDGAVYGFASGVGFSITESFMYISRQPDLAILIALGRAISTCLVHGTTTALVGAAIGRFRLRQHPRWQLMMAGGWGLAILVHAFFNGTTLITHANQRLDMLAAVSISWVGVGSIVLFILLGLREQQTWLVESLDQHMIDLLNADLTEEEQKWLSETLDQQAGVSVAEIRASQAYQTLDDVFEPLAQQFPQQAELMKHIVLQQAQIGIKRKLVEDASDPKRAERLKQEIARLEKDTKQRRQELDTCARAYLHYVFDNAPADVAPCLEGIVANIE